MRIINGECLETMRGMDACSVDAVVCDPPYAIGFCGAEWDSYGASQGNDTIEQRKSKSRTYADENSGAPRYGNSHGHAPNLQENVAFQDAMRPMFAEMLRVTKPGGYCLAFGSPRTFHRLACAIEESGWMLRDCISWVYSEGFPKGINVSKSIDKSKGNGWPDEPVSEEAKRWDGWHSQLKPAWEPILVAQKPLDGTVANNVLKWGVGAFNIDACRSPVAPHDSSREGEDTRDKRYEGNTPFSHKPGPRGGDAKGRFAANLVHDGSEEVLSCFPESPGQMGNVNKGAKKNRVNTYGDYPARLDFFARGDTGSAARFFYCAKANKADRNLGGVNNGHPSVKPNALMRWLVRLVCPPGGL